MKLFIRFFTALLASSLLVTTACAAAIVIASPNVTEQALSKQDVKNIFLGKRTKWSDGEPIVLVVMNGSAPYNEQFLNDFVEKNASQFNLYWKKAVFTGTGSQPKGIEDPNETVNFIAASKGAIGYIDESVKPTNIKIIEVK